MSRLADIRKHRLSFEIPGPNGARHLDFYTHEKISGTDVGYDIEESDLLTCNFAGTKEDFLDWYCPIDDVRTVVRNLEDWKSKLDVKARVSLQLVPERSLGGSGFLGCGIPGSNRQGLLIIEFWPRLKRELALEQSFEGDQFADLIPHELMHIKDVLDRRCPSLYPYRCDCGWIDFLRHLWIDGHLEDIGAPHPSRETISELRNGLPESGSQRDDSAFAVVQDWWGRPMTLRDAIKIGTSIGFTLDKASPLHQWFTGSPGQAATYH